MSRERNGKVQVATEVTPGLLAALETRADQEGLPRAIVLRRALMFHLNADANGDPVQRDRGPAPEYEALSAALGQHHVRVGGALDRMSAEEIRELQWAASELAIACGRYRRGPEAGHTIAHPDIDTREVPPPPGHVWARCVNPANCAIDATEHPHMVAVPVELIVTREPRPEQQRRIVPDGFTEGLGLSSGED